MNSSVLRGGGFIFLAVLLSLIAALIFLQPEKDPAPIVQKPTIAPTFTPTATATLEPSDTPDPTRTLTPTPLPTGLPTAAPQIVETAVAVDVGVDEETLTGVDGVVDRNASAYTLNTGQTRTQVIQYEVEYGDSLDAIAAKYGVTLETIIWSNGSFYVNAMRPGLVLNILPVDGALHKVETPITIADLAKEYQVDPYTIINSEFNKLTDAIPENILPEGLRVVIEGGIGKKEPIYWEPQGGAGSTFSVEGAVYQGNARWGGGQAGTCGSQGVYDGTVPTFAPVSGYVLTQNFSWTHRGLDLSAREGTPVKAVGAGTVIFAGWSDWGYGYTIVIAHGPLMTLYAHLTGTGFVWCGMHVEAGQHIANVGSTGRSSGPHLHFEIRDSNGVPQDPRNYLGFANCRGQWC